MSSYEREPRDWHLACLHFHGLEDQPLVVSVPVFKALTRLAGTAWSYRQSLQFSEVRRYSVCSVTCSRSTVALGSATSVIPHQVMDWVQVSRFI